MEFLPDPVSLSMLLFGAAVALTAGVLKGVTGFGMPMILISGLSTILPPDLALAGLILPTLVTNGWQALRQGWSAAWASIRKYRRFLITGGLVMVGAAQLVRVIPGGALLLLIGGPIVIYTLLSLLGRPLRLSSRPSGRVEAMVGATAGFFGGISGVWGPPTVAMLTAMNTEKSEQLRVQGVIYGLGSVLLLTAHMGSGVLNLKTLPFSAALVPPAMLGMGLGLWMHDRIDQKMFQRVTLLVLLVASLNLVRRGILTL